MWVKIIYTFAFLQLISFYKFAVYLPMDGCLLAQVKSQTQNLSDLVVLCLVQIFWKIIAKIAIDV